MQSPHGELQWINLTSAVSISDKVLIRLLAVVLLIGLDDPTVDVVENSSSSQL